MKNNLTLGYMTAEPGEKISGWMKIVNAEIEIPVTLICGTGHGPVVLITGGIHNAEYVGIQAAMELREELQAEKETLLNRQREQAVGDLYDWMKEKSLSVSDVKEMLGQQQ